MNSNFNQDKQLTGVNLESGIMSGMTSAAYNSVMLKRFFWRI